MSESAQFTPGPWEAGKPDGSYHDVIRIYGDGKDRSEDAIPVAVCFQQKSAIMEVLSGSTDETTEAAANARLIAAAPELLSALEKLVDEFGCSLELLERNGPSLTCADGEFVHSSVLSERAEFIEAARAAIAKATQSPIGMQSK